MIIQLQFSEIMGCANMFQRFLTLAVYYVSTPRNHKQTEKNMNKWNKEYKTKKMPQAPGNNLSEISAKS